MNKERIKQIVAEEVKRQRRRLFMEQNNPMEPQDNAQQQPQQPQQKAPVAAPENNQSPALNAKKAKGIIAGAIKTLINSGAVQGISPENVDAITADLLKNLDVAVKANSQAQPEADDSEEDNTDFDDAPAYEDEANELSDQNQYDPDLDKQIKDDDAEPEEAPANDMGGGESLFEAKDLKEFFR